MNLDICKKCEKCKCLMFFKNANGNHMADISLMKGFDEIEFEYGRKIGIKMVTSDFVVKKSGDTMLIWKIILPLGIADMEDFKDVATRIEDKWDFDDYVPYDRCKSICPYWLEHKISSLAIGEGK